MLCRCSSRARTSRNSRAKPNSGLRRAAFGNHLFLKALKFPRNIQFFKNPYSTPPENAPCRSAVLPSRREISAQAFVPVVFVVTDNIDDAAERVAAVKQRSRTFDDLDAFRAQRISRFAVVARLRADRSAAHTVLQNENAVAVKSANDGTRRARTETSVLPRRFPIFQNLADRCRAFFDNARRADRIDRLKRIENRLLRSRRSDRYLLFKRSNLQLKSCRDLAPAATSTIFVCVGKAFDVYQNRIASGRNIRNFVKCRFRPSQPSALSLDNLHRSIVQKRVFV